MRRRSAYVAFLSTALAGALTLPALAGAQVTPASGTAAGDDTQPASSRVGAVIFYDYTFQAAPKSTDANGKPIKVNAFNVARAYLNVTGNISHVISYRITPDINATRFAQTGDASNSLNGSLVFRLKYAYAQMSLTDHTGKWTGSYVRGGIQQTPFIDYQEGIYRYRFQGTVFAERDGGLSSADAGASFHANIPNNYGDFHVGIYNGENYNKGEVNDQKAIMIRGTLRPLPNGSALARGLRVTGFYDDDHVAKDAERTRAIFSVALEQRHYNANLDVLANKTDQATPTSAVVKQDGYSVFVTPFFKEKGNGWEMLVRYDSLRPGKNDGTAFQDRRQSRTIVGLAYWFPHSGGAGTAAVMLDYEGVRFKDYATTQAKQDRIFVHGLINF
ncbi:MAG: hypothetical protein ABI652_08265 [Acidobacteriota bacterium]